MDHRKEAKELADLLEKTTVDWTNKKVAIDFIEVALMRASRLVKNNVDLANVRLSCQCTAWCTGQDELKEGYECTKKFGHEA